ncbi:LuxR C-terminal-related transcriptional regulator [Chloroflexota bacterium]
MMREIGLLLVDSSQIFIEGLVNVLKNEPNIKVVCVCHTGVEAIKCAHECKPDVILIDTELSGCGDINVIQNIHADLPMVNIIALTSSEILENLIGCIRAGARAYISKNSSTENLVRVINLVADGEVVVSPPLATKVLEEFTLLEKYKDTAKLEDCSVLSKREQEVLSLVAQGFTNKDVATTLCISEQTVKVHMRNVMGKLHAHNRQQAVIVAKTIQNIPS